VRRIPSFKRFLIALNLDMAELDEQTFICDWYDWSPFERMAILLEDRRYLSHGGVDWKSVLRILIQSIYRKRKGGASTIEMQLVRTILDRRSITVKRKLAEMLRAILLNYRLDKKSLLRSYLGIAFFGSHLIGADLAAEVLFGKSPRELTFEEGAFLAAMLVYPKPMIANDVWKANVMRRAKYALALHSRLKERFD
jgi:monofunctional biosynthetic peptidoglycan transglycosylase